MRARHRETRERAGPTPCLPTPVTNDVPNGATISDDDSVDSSVYSQHSEPKGEFRDDDDGFLHIPQPLPAPNIVNEGAGPNIICEGDDPVNAPERSAIPPAPNIGTRKNRGHACQYPPAKNGFVVLIERWNAKISVSLNSRKLWVNSTELCSFSHLVHGRYLLMLRQCQRKEETKIQTTSEESSFQWRLGPSIDVHQGQSTFYL